MTASDRTISVIRNGACIVLNAFDVAAAIDLDMAGRMATEGTERFGIRHTRKAPPYFEYRPAPLRITREVEPIDLGGFQTAASVELLVYDFGAVSVSYRVDLRGPLSGLLNLSERLYLNVQLLALSRQLVEDLIRLIMPALRKPGVTDAAEDYLVFQITELEGGAPPSCLVEQQAVLLAQILRTETGEMSREELEDALACRTSYSPGDAAIIDWNAAILLDAEPDDARSVLEFANVELLEMRFLDDRLDAHLEESYHALAEQEGRRRWFLLPPGASDLARIGRMQADSALLFEGVNNALKLVGDQYLARVYRLAARRFHLPERDASIERKLRTLESIYGKINDYRSGTRMEVLEWIIIILIAAELILPFVGFGK